MRNALRSRFSFPISRSGVRHVKIASISPQFIVEAPPAAESGEQKAVAEELGLRLIRPEAASRGGGDSQSSLNSETREGLKRLSQLIQKSQAEKSAESTDEIKTTGTANAKSGKLNVDALVEALEVNHRKRQKAFELYRRLQEVRDPRTGRGEKIDDYL